MATYKDFSGSSSYYDEILNRLKSGDARIKTTAQSTGRVVQDEYGQYVWFPEQEQPGSPEIVPASDLSKYYDPVTEQYRSTKQVTVNPYIDLGNKPIAGMTEWPVQYLGNNKYQLSVMNSGENGYSNVILNADNTGKVSLTENTPAFFQPYDSGNFFSDFTGAAADLATSDAGKMLMLAAGAGVLPGVSPIAAAPAGGASAVAPAAATTGAGMLSGYDAAMADLAASAPVISAPAITAPAITAPVATGLLSGTDAALADLAASAPAISAPAAAATGAGLLGGAAAAEGVNLGTATASDLAMAYDPVAANIAAGMSPETAAAAALGTGYGAAAVGNSTLGALGTGAAVGGAGALTAQELARAGLIQGGLGLLGGLAQGESAKGAAEELAKQQAALAEKTLQMGKFQPVGVTTRFGTSAFTTDPVTGAITPSYTLSPEAKAYQDALAKMATQGLTTGQRLMNLGQGYIGESPEAVRKRYMETQLATLAPAQEQTLAGIRNQLQQTGRGGFATGATSPAGGGLLATSPELAAYYNSLANTQRALAAEAEKQYQGQVQFGQGLLNAGTTPFTNVFTAQKNVEAAGMSPLELSTNFANMVAQRGAAQGANYAQAMAPSLQAQYSANAFNPLATGLQGAANNPLTTYGLTRLFS